MAAEPIDPGVDIGHVHLKVADLDRALDFYCGVLGFELQQRFGDEAAFVSAGGYHHHIGLNTWQSKGGSPPAAGHDRPLPLRDPLPDPARPRRRAAAPDRQPASASAAPPTTASARPSTSTTPTATASSSTGTGPRRSGPQPAARARRSRCTRGRSTSATCSPSWTLRRASTHLRRDSGWAVAGPTGALTPRRRREVPPRQTSPWHNATRAFGPGMLSPLLLLDRRPSTGTADSLPNTE